MGKTLLDFFFPITAITPTPQASTAFLKQACVVVKPKVGVTPGVIHLCTSMSQVTALTANTEAQQLFNAGMNRVYILPVNDLDLAAELANANSTFYTLLISSDFDEDDIEVATAQGVATVTSYANLVSGTPDSVTVAGVLFAAQAGAVVPEEAKFQAATSNDATAASLAAQINAHPTTKALVVASVVGAVVTIKAKEAGWSGNDIAVAYTNGDANIGLTLTGLSGGKLAGGTGLFTGTFKGVVAASSTDDAFVASFASAENHVGFHTTPTTLAKNMMFALGKLLANALDWSNQQYIVMPFADDVDTLGEANALFDDKVSFVISDDEFGNRLSLLTAGGDAIVAPYIRRNLELDMQSRAMQYVSGNQPAYTRVQAALLQDELEKVVQAYIEKQWIEDGEVEVKLEQDNFVASAYMNIAKPTALWRIFGEIRQTL